MHLLLQNVETAFLLETLVCYQFISWHASVLFFNMSPWLFSQESECF